MSNTNATALAANLARSMTSSVRRNPARWASISLPLQPVLPPAYSAPVYSGTAYKTVPHVRVVWWWITLPAAAVVFANVFLGVAMGMTHWTRKRVSGVGVWKSSQIPLLYHGLDVQNETRMELELGRNANIGKMEDLARRLTVNLESSGGGGGMLKLSS